MPAESARVSGSHTHVGPERFFVAGGAMGELMRSFDWAATPVGPPETWPQSLRTAISILLDSRFPMLVLWGPELVQFYNDAFRPILGANKHPAALGQCARETWSEIWEVISPLFEGVMAHERATFAEDLPFFLDRNGYLEETYFTFCYSAIRNEAHAPGGVLVTCVETTPHVVAERRLRCLRELATRALEVDTVQEAADAAASTLAGNGADVPFALLYVFEAGGSNTGLGQARLVGASGLDPGGACAPLQVELQRNPRRRRRAASADPWEIASVAASGQAVRIEQLAARLPPLPIGPWPEPPQQALVLPVAQASGPQPLGALVVGVSPRLPLDEAYQSFLELAAGQIATGLANADARAAERRRTEALAELDRAKTAFFSNVSHELRTPLTLVLGPLEDALAQTADPAERDRLEVAHRNALRLLRLVNTLLDFSRIQAGRMDAMYELVDLPAYTAELASTFRSAFERAGVALEVECPPLPEGVDAYVDADMWEKVVLNLLANALKFTLEGKVAVRVAATDAGRVELSVTDTGVGIPAQELPRLFERFHRVEGAGGRTHEGSGIGLALVNDLVRLHGGAVQVQSEPGRGSRFSVTLPTGRDHLPPDRIGQSRAPRSTAIGPEPFVAEALRWLPAASSEVEAVEDPERASISTSAVPATRGARVLVVDDNADMREYLSRLLAPTYLVEAVGDANSAVGAVERQRPDLVLSDVMLPGLDGLGLLRRLRARRDTATVPVVLLSARAGEDARIEGLRAGADDYIIKPFSARELLARVESQLRLAGLRADVDRERQRRYDAERRARKAAERVQQHLLVRDAVGAVLVEASLEDGPPRILDAICRGFGWDWAVFWQVDVDDRELQPIATWKSPELAAADFEAATRKTRFVRGLGMPGQAWLTGRAKWITDVRRDPGFARRDSATADALRTGVALPVRSGGKVVAVLELLSRQRRRQDAGVLATLEAIGAKVGQFVERRRAEAALQRSEAGERAARLEAEAAVRAREEFVATVSHDLGNSLAAIKGHVQLLRRRSARGGALGPEQLDMRLATVEGAATEMERMIGDLLDAARLQAGGALELRRQPTDLVTLARECVARYEHSAARHFRFDATVPEAIGAWDAERVQRVMANVLSNAVKYSSEGSEIAIAIEVEDGQAVLTVRDHGLGIPATDLPHVFQRYRRGSNVADRVGGTGIGLAGAKEIIEQHGGTIVLTSEEGRGTTVEVRLPLVKRAAPAEKSR